MNIKASSWVKDNFEWLVKEYGNKWVGASSEGYVSSGDTFDLALRDIEEKQMPLSEIVFIYLTEEAIQ